MSYVETHRPAPFGATTAQETMSEIRNRLRQLTARPLNALATLGPDDLEDIGLNGADRSAWTRPDLFTRLAASWQRWHSRRQTIIELERLSPRQLEDIGLRRADIDDLRMGRPIV